MAGAISGATIAAIAAMVAGSALQYKASADAQRRQREEIARGLAAQRDLQVAAERKALDKAQEFAPGERIAQQSKIADQITHDLIQPVSESQSIRSQQTTTQGDVSDDYTRAKAASTAEQLKVAENMARLLGKTTSSSRLRLNEGIGLMDTGQAIDQLNSFSRGRNAADNIAIQQAGLLDPTQVFVGQLLQSAGTAGLMAGAGAGASSGTAGGSGVTASSSASASPYSNFWSTGGGTGLNANSTGAGGLRILG